MLTMAKTSRAWLMGVVLGLLLSACGGGGGGSSGSNEGSGLLPPAEVAGATLHADALVLRPLRDRAIFTYRGQQHSKAPFGFYTNTVRQLAVGGDVREDASNLLGEGPDTGTPLRTASGAVTQHETLQLAEGAAASFDVDLVELRSPVRIHDRYVMLDRHLADYVDFDRNGSRDTLDVAVWATVVGEEVLDLPNRAGVKAVRVDTFVRTRVTYIGSQFAPGGGTVTLSRWYAPGLGLVKVRRESPAVLVTQPNEVVEEVLVTADVIDSGLGYAEASKQTVPAGSSLAGQDIAAPIGAVAFDSHAVVMTAIPGPFVQGFALHQLDPRGQVLATAVYRYADFPQISFPSEPQLVRVGSELRVFVSAAEGVYMLSLDKTGQQLTSASATLAASAKRYPVGGRAYLAAGAADGFWLSWTTLPIDDGDGPRSQFKLQYFDAAGRALGVEYTADPSISPVNVYAPRLEASADRALLSWAFAVSADRMTSRYVVAGVGAPALLADQVLSPLPTDKPCLDASFEPQFIGTLTVLACSSNQSAAVVPLDAAFAPLRDANGSLREDPILQLTQGIPSYRSESDRLSFMLRRYEPFWPGENSDGFYVFGDLRPAGGTLDAAAPRLSARVPMSLYEPQWMLPMGNRSLSVGSESGVLHTMVVWRE